MSVSCSYIFLVVVNHSRTYYGPGMGAEADSNGSLELFKTYVHVRNGNSIPLMEQRQLANKPGYAAYRKQTRILI